MVLFLKRRCCCGNSGDRLEKHTRAILDYMDQGCMFFGQSQASCFTMLPVFVQVQVLYLSYAQQMQQSLEIQVFVLRLPATMPMQNVQIKI